MSKVAISHTDNYRLEAVTEALRENFDALGLPSNNPFSTFIHPGNKVFIKPNWVASRWRESCSHKDTLYSVITHPAVIEAAVSFVATSLDGEGEIIIGDNPSIDADFSELMTYTGIQKIKDRYGIKISFLDLRPMVCDNLEYYGKRDKMVHQQGDPIGSVEVNLGKNSLFYGVDPSRFRGVFDEREDTIRSHTGETQLYSFSRSLYDADVYISIPKMKTHQKVGCTLNLKGLVGTIADKNQLVHWRVGYPEIQGDEYPNQQAWEEGQRARVTHRGSWPGNDTIWRMVVDLYHAFGQRARTYFSIIDGITGGEGQGPFCPTSKNANTLIAGNDLLAVDCVAARYMGLDPLKIHYLAHLIQEQGLCLDKDICVMDGDKQHKGFFASSDAYADFHVMNQWKSIKWKGGGGNDYRLHGGRL